jgi:hypothetical protein
MDNHGASLVKHSLRLYALRGYNKATAGISLSLSILSHCFVA